MSASFPSVPGFIGPLALKTFFENYFSLKLSFGSRGRPSKAARGGNTPSHVMQEVVLPVNESFLVVVYVARYAPTAPLPATPAASLPLKLPSSSSKSTSVASWLLYTRTDDRLLTNTLLQHPWWLSFSSLLGPAGIAFVELYCPIVLQLDAMAGGIQVLGPALQHAASPVVRSNVVHRRREMKRERDEAASITVTVRGSYSHSSKKHRAENKTGRTTAPSQKRQNASSGFPQNGKRENGTSPIKRRSTCSIKAASTWEVALPRTDVSRTRLYSLQSTDMADAKLHSVPTREEERETEPVPASLLEVLWVGRHPRSFSCSVRAALPRWQASRLERLTALEVSETLSPSKKSDNAEDTSLCLPLCFVRHVFRWMQLPPSTFGVAEAERVEIHDERSFNVGTHLQRVLSSVLDQCSRLDLRGAALKHLRYIEARFQRQQQAKESSDIQRLAAPVDVVVSYLRTLLSTFRWHSPAASTLASSHQCSFWGVEEVGATRVLDALLAALRAWLSTGRHAVFPVSRFLDGLPVAQLPWLAGFFTNPASKSTSAASHARRRRSQIQQRVWLQFVLFLTQDIIPFVVRSSFAVTWSPKNPNRLLFYPSSVWRRVVRCELRRAVGSTGNSPPSNGGEPTETRDSSNSCSPLSFPIAEDGTERPEDNEVTECLLRNPSSNEIDQRRNAATLIARNGTTSLLYAGVRFRPDGRKLRPIAVLRSASVRSIKAVARGTPSPYSHPAALLRLLTKMVARLGVTMPPCTANVLAWARRMDDKRGHDFQLHLRRPLSSPSQIRQHPHKAALRGAFQCLVSGVEQRRVRSGLPKLSNLSHRDEYAELRSFCEETRCQAEGKTNEEGDAPRLFLVRSDALRCYDNLPQTRVLEEAQALVCHDTYRTLTFTAVFNAPRSCESAPPLCRTTVHRTIPSADIAKGQLALIPCGHVYREEESKDNKSSADTRAAALSGLAVRALLSEHLQHHLIVINGRLFEQRVGILQGSPVAMLLCDQLFESAVDTSLSRILSEHAERSLLLRRVDDVLLATSSAIAAQRCLHAMQCGWPSVGYRSNARKLTISAANGQLVPWCGLLLDDTTLETSVEWRRMGPVLSSLRVADTLRVHCGDREPLFFTQRLLAVVHLRVPPTALCGRINSKPRQLGTFYEAALLWSRLIVRKVQEALATAHHRCVAVLLLRPLAACIARLCRLLRRHQEFLKARQSSCDVCNADVRACVLTALHRTLQAKRRVLMVETVRLKDTQQQHHRRRCLRGRERKEMRSSVKEIRGTKGAPRDGMQRHGGKHQSKKLSALRAFWWCAASRIEAQWCSSLAALEHKGVKAKPTEEDVEPRKGSVAAAAHLLMETGPSSLHMQALRAIQPLFQHDTDKGSRPNAAR